MAVDRHSDVRLQSSFSRKYLFHSYTYSGFSFPLEWVSKHSRVPEKYNEYSIIDRFSYLALLGCPKIRYRRKNIGLLEKVSLPTKIIEQIGEEKHRASKQPQENWVVQKGKHSNARQSRALMLILSMTVDTERHTHIYTSIWYNTCRIAQYRYLMISAHVPEYIPKAQFWEGRQWPPPDPLDNRYP